MRFARLALRNLARNRRRTALSLAVVAAGTAGLTLTAGFVRFSFDGLREAVITGGLGHLEVARADAVARRRSSYELQPSQGLDDWRALQAEIERLPRVVAAAPTLHVMGMAGNEAGDSISFLGLGVDPERERRMGFSTKLLRGRDLAPQAPAEGAEEALLATGLAESLAAEPGDVVTLVAMTAEGRTSVLDVRVAGVATTGVRDLDTRFLKLHLESAQRLLRTERASDLIVALDDTRRTAAVGAELERRLAGHAPPLAVVDWQTRAPFYGQVRALYRQIFWFMGGVIVVLVVLAASNTLVMAVLERVREIGTLRAIGTSAGQVAAMLLWEAAWLGLLGAVAGDFLALGLIALINSMDLEMGPPPGAVLPIELRLAVVPEALAGAVVLMLAVLALGALGPILRAVRLRIVDALGHV
jgi:putative ABC transport system permease protein